ncbi:hypothetical protein ALC57_12208 [Trachymyrmex cornetzi]|uniref:CCHC-type domain-containing protein n=1 Tax=Trachymyrmex cornetzi TaxID=471704 RepID=A0A151J1B4_9HYME|nr:hypothetical protein ALC57_12208 [Trachymyrmex cornetzi]
MTNNGIIEYTSSTTINIKFAGQILPKYISLYFDIHNVSPFILRVKTCFSCFRIGHIGKFCKSRPRCGLCGKDPHGDKDTCERNNLPPLCINCAGDHPSTSSSCPLFIKQKEILPATDNISLSEARRRLYGGNSSPPPFSPSDITLSMERNFRNFPLLRRGDRDNSSDLREPPSYSYNKFDPLATQADHFQHRPKYSQVVSENPTDNRNSRGSGASRIPPGYRNSRGSGASRISPGQNQLKHTLDYSTVRRNAPKATSQDDGPRFQILNAPNGRLPSCSGNGIAFSNNNGPTGDRINGNPEPFPKGDMNEPMPMNYRQFLNFAKIMFNYLQDFIGPFPELPLPVQEFLQPAYAEPFNLQIDRLRNTPPGFNHFYH